MIVRAGGPEFGLGYTAITEESGVHSDMLMDFGILRLSNHETFASAEGKERAILLMTGEVRFSYETKGSRNRLTCERRNLLDEEPYVLHVPHDVAVRIECTAGTAELAIQARFNQRSFPPRLWKPGDYRSEQFGKGAMQETSTRTVRTVFDAATAPASEMVLGEVINHPGKWSSYPPHDHAHPEVYHYRFFPNQGYGHAECEDEIFKVRDRDSYLIPPGLAHSQCAAPGYAMYYLWAIPHLPGDRFGPDSRVYREDHAWLLNTDAPIWPDRRIGNA